MRIYSFEKLDVRKLSGKRAKIINAISAGFPNEEKFGLISQLEEHQSQYPLILLK